MVQPNCQGAQEYWLNNAEFFSPDQKPEPEPEPVQHVASEPEPEPEPEPVEPVPAAVIEKEKPQERVKEWWEI